MKKRLTISLCFLTAFVLWTVALCFIDVQAIGPEASRVGFATVNGFFHRLTGMNLTLYTVTDWLGLVPVAFCIGFAVLGLAQWLKRKSLFKVDRSIFALGGFYIAVITVYMLFEKLVINYRPVLIQEVLEVSYPSSTTLLVMCVMPTAILQLRSRIKKPRLRAAVVCSIAAFTLFMVIGRLLSGVHWLSDIIGGGLLSAGLVSLYHAITK